LERLPKSIELQWVVADSFLSNWVLCHQYGRGHRAVTESDLCSSMFPALTHPLAETGSKVVKTAFFIANFVEGFSCVVKKPN